MRISAAVRHSLLPALTPRLLPLTVFCLGSLLAMKSVSLVRAAAPAVSTPGASTPGASAPGAPAPGSLVPGGSAAGSPPGPAPGPKPGPTGQHSTTPAPATHGDAVPATAAPEGVANAEPAAKPPPISDSERTVLLELRERRQELEARAQTLAAREAVLAAAERKIAARVDELKSLQARLEALDSSRKERDEASWRGLVKVYETMKPREAATIMNDLDMPVLLAVVDRMREAKAAAILALMLPDKARQVTTELAQMRQRTNNLNRAGG